MTNSNIIRGVKHIRLTHLLTGGLLLICTSSAVHAQTNWVKGLPGTVPADAIIGGHEANGTPLYVCVGTRLNSLQPGKFRSDFAGCDVGFGGQEISLSNFNILVSSWKNESNGVIPPNAVQGGSDTPLPGRFAGPPLYYCRANVHGSLQPGKIRSGFDSCYIPYGGQELHVTNYQVLVALNPSVPLTTVSAAGGYIPPDAIRGGTDSDNQPLYICSAYLNGGMHPGKLRADFGACDISWGGMERLEPNYNVLVAWWPSSPSLARQISWDFPAGSDIDGATLYVCRAADSGGLHPGKSKWSLGTCNFGFGGVETTSSAFDVLSTASRIP